MRRAQTVHSISSEVSPAPNLSRQGEMAPLFRRRRLRLQIEIDVHFPSVRPSAVLLSCPEAAAAARAAWTNDSLYGNHQTSKLLVLGAVGRTDGHIEVSLPLTSSQSVKVHNNVFEVSRLLCSNG